MREKLLGNDFGDVIAASVLGVEKLPVTAEVWAAAAAITQHIKTLDALHLATCELVAADLITFDRTMREIAQGRGVRVVGESVASGS